MTPVFLICATVGGTILVCQLVLTLIGLAGDTFDSDVGHDVGGDFHGDAGGDFHGDAGGDFHGDAGGDFHGGDAGADHAMGAEHHGGNWFLGMLSLRSVTAALTFFGLAGLAAQSAGAAMGIVLLAAAGAGLAALYGVYRLMRWLSGLSSDGTVRIHRAIGHHGSVYLRIPGHNAGTGKIQIALQNRTVELLATTGGDPLPAGARVLVLDVLTSNTVVVEPALEPEQIQPERINHV